MTDEHLREFEPLWTTELARYALIGLEDNAQRPRFGIVNIETRMALVIEDNDLYAAVVGRMIAAGVRRLSDIPKDW